MTKLSIIIPCYNCERYVSECLDSVLKALSAEDEVVCVDDGSSDGTLEILRNVSDSRVRVISQENRGPGAARNTGIEASSGDQVIFVDADDTVSPAMIQIVKMQPENSLCSCQLCMKLISNQKALENKTPEQLKVLDPSKTLSSKEVKLSLMNDGYSFSKWIYRNNYEISGPVAKTYCREILMAQHVRFPESLKWGEDVCFNLQYLRHIDEVSFMPVNAYWYRKVSDSLINRYYSEKHLEIQGFLKTAHSLIDGRDEKEREAFMFLSAKQYIYALQFDFCSRYNPEPFSVREKKAWALIEGDCFVKEGIEHCQAQYMSTSVKAVILLIRSRQFRALDITMKLYTALK